MDQTISAPTFRESATQFSMAVKEFDSAVHPQSAEEYTAKKRAELLGATEQLLRSNFKVQKLRREAGLPESAELTKLEHSTGAILKMIINPSVDNAVARAALTVAEGPVARVQAIFDKPKQ